jgi:hypothetical protein
MKSVLFFVLMNFVYAQAFSQVDTTFVVNDTLNEQIFSNKLTIQNSKLVKSVLSGTWEGDIRFVVYNDSKRSAKYLCHTIERVDSALLVIRKDTFKMFVPAKKTISYKADFVTFSRDTFLWIDSTAAVTKKDTIWKKQADSLLVLGGVPDRMEIRLPGTQKTILVSFTPTGLVRYKGGMDDAIKTNPQLVPIVNQRIDEMVLQYATIAERFKKKLKK